MFEDLKKEQRGGTRGPGSFLKLYFLHVADPRVRIFILCGLVVVLGGAFLGLRHMAADPENKRLGPDVPSREIGLSGHRRTFTGEPSLDRARAERITDTGPDARRRWEDEAVSYLLLEAKHTPAVSAYNNKLIPLLANSAGTISRDSRPLRFKFVRFRGELEYIREENYEQVYGGENEIGQMHRARLRVDGSDGLRVVFVTAIPAVWSDPNQPIPEVMPITGGWVRGRGIFVKNYIDVEEDGTEVPAVLVVATLVERDYALVPPQPLSEIPFGIIDDDPALAGDPVRKRVLFKKYPQPFFRLLRHAEARVGKEGAAQRAKDGLEPESFDDKDTYERIIGQPVIHRARYYGGLGVIAMDPVYYGPDVTEANDAGVEEYLAGWILTDKQLLFQYVAPASLDTQLRKKARIRYEGYFYKTRAYPARNGTDRLCAMMVLTVLEEVKPPPPDYTLQFILAAGFLVGMGFLIFVIVREDKTKADYRRWRRKRTIAVE